MPDKVPEVPGTHKVHFIDRTCSNGKSKLTFFLQSQFCEPVEEMLREQLYDLNDGVESQVVVSYDQEPDPNLNKVENSGQVEENGDQDQIGSQLVNNDQLPWKVVGG